MDKVKVGVIGCGNISSVYLKNCKETFDVLEISVCSDIVHERAAEKAQEFNVPKACSVEELLRDDTIEIILNLTVPKVHTDITMKALEAGKNVYSEKPLATKREDGKAVLLKAKEKGLLVGCAPDTFLGGGLQTCRKLVDDGWIGRPVAATAFMVGHGPEEWHPNPDFFYQECGGPLSDMGPYYLTALISLLGPVSRVTGMAKKSFEERIIGNPQRYGEKIKVEIPTHITGIMEFENGAVGNIITSFDVWKSQLPRMEIYGSEGTLIVPDPNTFGGPVYINRLDKGEWMEVPLTHGFCENSRGIGLADMAYALRSGRKHRANEEFAYHVIDIINSIFDSAAKGEHCMLSSTCERPEPVPCVLLRNALGL